MNNNQFGNTIYVDSSSELGQIMHSMNINEEKALIESCKKDLESGKINKTQAINGLQNFMMLWNQPMSPPTRTFYLVPNYINELNNTNHDNNCVLS